MAVTGLILILFLLAHMFGNLKLLFNDGGAEFNEYSHLLRRLFYPALPPMLFLWCFRILLLLSVILHMWSAYKLTVRRYSNVGGGRYATKKNLEKSYAARTMIWGGIIIVLFVILHLLQFTAQVIRVNYPGGATSILPYDRAIDAFKIWWVVVAYLIAMLAVCLHVSHGFYSAFTTLGANTSIKARSVLRGLSWLVAAVIFIGFMIPPVLILSGVIPR